MRGERLLWALGGAGLGIGLFALVESLIARQRSSRRGAGAVTPAPELGLGSSAPAESWRGSGLAEDVGVDRQPSEEAESEAEKQRMMREAARELGLPE
jgi:hypothetical protein